MALERTVEGVLEGLVDQAKRLWGETDAERQRVGLSGSADQIVTMSGTPIAVDVEPQFF